MPDGAAGRTGRWCEGLAAHPAFRTQDWLRAAFWCAIGLVIRSADTLKRKL
jgi:hypothetical protein